MKWAKCGLESQHFGNQKHHCHLKETRHLGDPSASFGCAWGLGGLAREGVTICCHHLPSHLRHTIFTNDFRENRLSQALQALSRVQTESLSSTLCRSLQWRVVRDGPQALALKARTFKAYNIPREYSKHTLVCYS